MVLLLQLQELPMQFRKGGTRNYQVDEKLQDSTGALVQVVEWDSTNRIFIMSKKNIQTMD